ncbi:hypothetical protein [Nostoc sp.]|uniref:hypothetical protein n=1 Tax=Nostoc sp. TaxID=1180 RepID=UPI002FFAFB10
MTNKKYSTTDCGVGIAKGGQDFGVSATSLREAAPTTTLLRRRSVQVSTSQSNAAHPQDWIIYLLKIPNSEASYGLEKSESCC